MTPLVAAILGMVEGITEYLPISSTGHLILTATWLGLEGDASKSFEIVIQLGAILAVVIQYRRLLGERAIGLVRKDKRARDLAIALAVAFVPAALVGVLLRKAIKAHLFGMLPVAAAFVVGGVFMIAVERFRKASKLHGLDGLEHVSPKRALAIGVGQCFALWPGASRSMCTIVAGQLTGLSTATAAEFSFLLALPTLGAATIYEGYKARSELASSIGGVQLAIGLGVSFLVAWAVIAGFIRYLQKRGLEPFGWYRIVVGALLLWIFWR
jgi:undecaprenyl-diphosphatase